MLPCGNDKKEFISYRNCRDRRPRLSVSYIEFAKRIYRTSVSEYIANKPKISLWFGFFSYIWLTPSDIVLAQFKDKYNITANGVCNITFDLSKISLHQRWNIT